MNDGGLKMKQKKKKKKNKHKVLLYLVKKLQGLSQFKLQFHGNK